MTEEWKIVDIQAGELNPGVPGWMLYMQKPNGDSWAHAIPRLVLEWRSAEYGIGDLDEILDLILHENYAEADAVPNVMVSVTQSVTKQAKPVRASLPGLFEAKSTKEALDAHRVRVARVKTDRVRVTDPKGLLAHIKSAHRMDPESVREKAEAVDTHRWMKLYGGLPIENGKET